MALQAQFLVVACESGEEARTQASVAPYVGVVMEALGRGRAETVYAVRAMRCDTTRRAVVRGIRRQHGEELLDADVLENRGRRP